MNVRVRQADLLRLSGLLGEFREALSTLRTPPPAPPIPVAQIAATLESFRAPLASARASGVFMNPWTMAGLKADEVKTTAALAGLWNPDIGGDTARNFLSAFLAGSGISIDGDYTIRTEVNPLGLISDRIDMMIECRDHIIGIEVKIYAGETRVGQLRSYREAVQALAKSREKKAWLVFLAPDRSSDADCCRNWKDVSNAAFAALPRRRRDYNHNHWLIAHFADHVRNH